MCDIDNNPRREEMGDSEEPYECFIDRFRPDGSDDRDQKKHSNLGKSGGVHIPPFKSNLVKLRRTICDVVLSSVDYEEAGRKLIKLNLEPGQEIELMLLECCSQEFIYLRCYGLLANRICRINKVHQEKFEKCFVQQYSTIDRLETSELRNVAEFFAHLLGTRALSWHVLSCIRLTEEDTTPSSRVFIEIIFQELSELLGIQLLNERLADPTLQDSFESIFPRDNPKNTRFSINFFTAIGLGGLTESLREYLEMQQQKPMFDSDEESTSSNIYSEIHIETETDSDSSSEGEDMRSGKKRRKTSRGYVCIFSPLVPTH